MTVGDLPERLEQSSSRDHDPSIGSALEGAKLTVRRALEAADNANHAGEQAVLRMEQALVAPLTDFGDIAAAAYEKVVGGSFEDLEAHEQQFYINFAVEAALSSAKPSDGEGSRDELLELIRSLEGENARLTGERDHYQRRAEDAEGSLTQADVAVEAAEDRAQKAEARLGSHDYCMCGDRMDVHDTWSGHAPVSQYDYRLEEAESHLQEALATIERMRAALEKAEADRDLFRARCFEEAKYSNALRAHAAKAESAEASLAKAVEGLEKLIDHFEDDGAHDEGAFDDGCSDCHVLQSARETLASIRQEPKGSEAYAKREGEEGGSSSSKTAAIPKEARPATSETSGKE